MEYRDTPITVVLAKGLTYQGPPPEEVPRLMKQFFQDINELLKNKSYDAIYKSGVAQVHFFHIHPFKDHNGHIGRFLSNVILLHYKEPLLQIDSKIDVLYSSAIHGYDLSKDPTVFLGYLRKKAELQKGEWHE